MVARSLTVATGLRLNRLTRLAPSLTVCALAAVFAPHVRGQALCQATTFTITSLTTVRNPHNALLVTDPAQQQTAIFDLYWGGMLVSLKYQGREYIDQPGLANGSGLQVAIHHGADVTDYNPTQAGGNPYFPSAVMGASCNSSGVFNMWTATLDYNRNSTGRAPVVGVFNGDLELGEKPEWQQIDTNGFFTPYVIQTYGSWVVNPSGAPAYYLKLTQRITNVGYEDIPWSFDLAAYFSTDLPTPRRFPAYCTDTNYCTQPTADIPLVGGSYLDGSGAIGVAVGLLGGSSLLTPPEFWFIFGTSSVHLFSGRYAAPGQVPPGRQLLFDWYVMVGPWANALAFAGGPSAPIPGARTDTMSRRVKAKRGDRPALKSGARFSK